MKFQFWSNAEKNFLAHMWAPARKKTHSEPRRFQPILVRVCIVFLGQFFFFEGKLLQLTGIDQQH